jgi:FkbM family methyltransferase
VVRNGRKVAAPQRRVKRQRLERGLTNSCVAIQFRDLAFHESQVPQSRLRRLVQSLLGRAGYRIIKLRAPIAPINVLPLVVEDWRRRKAARGDDTFTFVQIGAHDGLHYDPIRPFIERYGWRGILVEPQPTIFKQLVANYAGQPQLTFVNAAIAETDGTATLYRFRDGQGLPEHATMLASFYREALARNGHGYVGEIEAISVPAISLPTLFARHSLLTVDLLQVDTEGFDVQVVTMLGQLPTKPAIVHFESFTNTADRLQEVFTLLEGWGYRVLTIGVDTLAYRQEADHHFDDTLANAGYA